MTCAVAMTHAFYVLNWYFAFSGTDKYANVLEANTSYGQIAGFQFESLGNFALICLMILAATSHDFWLKFLSAPVWKSLHYLIYPAYAAVVGHVAFGVLQDQQNQTFAWMVGIGAGTVAALHIAAALKERFARDYAGGGAEWIDICPTSAMTEGYAKIAKLPSGERVAVYLNEGKLSAISNACAHQNGPLGEGKIIDCLVTCPWHGFQYNVTNGQSPAPFTEKCQPTA